MKRTIKLLKIGDITQSVLVKLKKNLEKSFKGFNLSINTIQGSIPLEKVEYNPKRRQYNAIKILKKIIIYAQNKKIFHVLGVIDKDIFFNGLRFVFGRAIKPEERVPESPIVALISITRLRESFYGRTVNKGLFELRILKEAIHELGHTFSLEHCNKYCIMRFSNSLADTDDKPPNFCKDCLKRMLFYLKNS
ncbi:MAG: archaemetzincin family Zn-dependent metalloprotease [Candidatus Lokiarchaeota archaeon]|nr:archaemetzincin family Zn-dependent metalloprotease [Candidatus Lokiarchaeota archaeon]